MEARRPQRRPLGRASDAVGAESSAPFSRGDASNEPRTAVRAKGHALFEQSVIRIEWSVIRIDQCVVLFDECVTLFEE